MRLLTWWLGRRCGSREGSREAGLDQPAAPWLQQPLGSCAQHHWAPWERLWGRGRPWKGLSWFSKALSSLLMAPSPGLLRRALRLPWEQPGGLQKGQAPGKELQVAGGSEPGSEPGQVE